MRRHIIRALVAAVVLFGAWRAFKKHRLDTTFADAPEVLRPCLSQLPEDVIAYAVDEQKSQAASWGKSQVGLCDAIQEGEPTLFTTPGPYVLERPGITTAAFIGTDLWLGFPGRLEHVGFGPPTGMDGALYVWDDERPLKLDLDGAPAKLKRDGQQVIVTNASGKSVSVALPH